MRERSDTLTRSSTVGASGDYPNEIIDLIKDIFDEEELNYFYNYIDKNNDKEKAESIKNDMIKLLSK